MRFSDTERTALAFTEQFVLDVSGVTPADRSALEEHLAADTGSFVLSLYAVEYALRAPSQFCTAV